ncbi:uncharacterized protein PAE49_006138 isoform 4-T4 [Odontesthes bonariensis]
MSSVQHLREFISQRLTAAAEEIFSEFEKTIVQYEEEIGRQRRLLDISWKPQINFHRVELPQYYLCEEEIPVNLEKDSSLDQEEPEPPQIKEEPVEVCTSHEEQQLLLKQETDNPTVTLTYEESDLSEAEPTNVQLQDQSQDQEGSGRESTGNAELRPKKRRHSNDGDNSSMSESPRNTAKDLSQQYVCEEKEKILTDQQFFNHESNSSLDQQEPEPPQFKEELEERCTSQEEEWLELKQETDILSVTPTYEESELTSEQLLSQNSSVAERQEMEKNLRDEESESTQNSKLKPHKRRGRNINHSNDVINESQFNADTGDQAVKCEVCGKAFMSYSELTAHSGMHTELPQYYLCEEEIPVNLEKDSSLDQEEPEPPQIKEEQVEVCTSHEEQQLLLKQETDNLTVTLTNEESDRSEAEPTNVQLQDQSQDQEGSGRESTGNAEPRPKKRRHSNDGDNSSMSESHRNTAKDLSQQYVCEEEILTDQQFFNHESNSSLDQQEPEPPQFKEELEERCTSQEEEGLELKQETDILYVTPTYEESELTSDQLLSQNSSVAERQEMEKNLRDEESESTQNAKLKPNKRRGRSINHSNDVINESQFNADTGDQAVKCEVCGKGFMSYSELRAHYGMHTGEKPYSCEICKKAFRYNNGLLVHMRTHTGEKPYVCKTFGENFSKRSTLEMHSRIHTGEKPFSCSVVNAWLLYKRHCQALKMPKKEIINMRKFQAQVASSLILVNTTPKTPKRGRPSSNPDAAGSPLNAGKRPSPGDGSPKCPSSKKACTHPPQDVRNDQTGHFPMKSKEDTSDESMDESSHSDYNDVDYIPDTDGTNSDVSMSLSPDKPRQRLQVSHMIPVMANNPDKESSSTDSPDKESSTKRNAVRKKMGSSFIPGKKKKRTVSLQERRNTSRHPEKGSSAIVSPEKDKGSIEVPRTTSTQERRVYDKRSYCLYCSKPTAKISRHLQTVHRNKPDVAKALFYPQNSKERRVRLAVLRNRGNFSHNTDVVREGRGDLVARYRTKDIRNGKDFIHCIHCQGLYSKKTLWKHIKTCNEKPGEDEPRVGRKRVRSLCALTTPVSCEISEGL